MCRVERAPTRWPPGRPIRRRHVELVRGWCPRAGSARRTQRGGPRLPTLFFSSFSLIRQRQ
eukprot:scaffold68282_cov28-Tisochrysis_lutea.AAC.5